MPLRLRSFDSQLLWLLRKAGENGVAGSDLCTALQTTSVALQEHVVELRGLGYEIETGPHFGYRLLRCPNALHADDLLARLPGSQVIGRDIRIFNETTSTNDVIERFARDGLEEGVVVFAESQTKGRGRLGRQWASPPGSGLWFSILLRPKLAPQAATRLTIGAATALARAISAETGLQPSIKWPNDLLHKGRKLAGILTEMNAELDSVRHIILGIGINVNQFETDFPDELRSIATSLRVALRHTIDRPSLAARVLQELDADYRRILSGEFSRICEEWESQCGTVGEAVEVRMGDRIIAGRCESLDDDGALLVRSEHGRLERITGGDVTVLKR